MAFGGENKILIIIDLYTKYEVKEMVYDSYFNYCKFSNDSNLIMLDRIMEPLISLIKRKIIKELLGNLFMTHGNGNVITTYLIWN